MSWQFVVTLSCAVLIGLLSLSQLFRPQNRGSPTLSSFSLSAAERPFTLLKLYYVAYFIFILVLASVWLIIEAQLAFKLLSELCWLNGLIFEAFILYNTLRESDFYIFTALLTGGASALQVVGFGVLFYSVRIGKILAYIGALTFHLSAAVVFFYLYNYGLSGQKYLYFTMAYAAVTLIGGPIILINNEDIFLMTHCGQESIAHGIFFFLSALRRLKEDNFKESRGYTQDTTTATIPKNATHENTTENNATENTIIENTIIENTITDDTITENNTTTENNTSENATTKNINLSSPLTLPMPPSDADSFHNTEQVDKPDSVQELLV